MSEELPNVVTETPQYDAQNPEHVRQWIWAGRPALNVADADGNFWRPTITKRLTDGVYVQVDTPDPNPLVQGIANYQLAYQSAELNIFRLMTIVAGAMIAYAGFTEENVNEEGGDFVDYHQAPINAYKLSGRGPAKALALYVAIAKSESRIRFPWLDQALPGGGKILDLFAMGLEVQPPEE